MLKSNLMKFDDLLKKNKNYKRVVLGSFISSKYQIYFFFVNFQLKSETLILAYIERCKEVNPLLNAIVENRFEAALEEARAVDDLIQSGKKTIEELEEETPLLGIPITVKESIGVKGYLSTNHISTIYHLFINYLFL